MSEHSLRLSVQAIRDSRMATSWASVWWKIRPDQNSISDGVLRANDRVDYNSFVISKTL